MWEKVSDNQGREYYWNVETDEVSWEPPLKRKEKTLVKTNIEVKNDNVKLTLLKCQPPDKILNRVWGQLSQSKREANEMECIYKNNIVMKTITNTVFILLTNFFKYWKDVVYEMKINDSVQKVIYVTRWKEHSKYKTTFCDVVKKLHSDNYRLLQELINTKAKLAEENYKLIKKK